MYTFVGVGGWRGGDVCGPEWHAWPWQYAPQKMTFMNRALSRNRAVKIGQFAFMQVIKNKIYHY